jgi:hypothetical protein
MSSSQEHTRQAQHNRNLIDRLDPATTPFLDWVVTITFYAALHLIEAWFAERGRHTRSHEQRDDWMSRAGGLRRDVYRLYKDLEYQSHRARYQCVNFERQFVQAEILPKLEALEHHLFP